MPRRSVVPRPVWRHCVRSSSVPTWTARRWRRPAPMPRAPAWPRPSASNAATCARCRRRARRPAWWPAIRPTTSAWPPIRCCTATSARPCAVPCRTGRRYCCAATGNWPGPPACAPARPMHCATVPSIAPCWWWTGSSRRNASHGRRGRCPRARRWWPTACARTCATPVAGASARASPAGAPTTPTCPSTPPPSTCMPRRAARAGPSCMCRNTPRRPPCPRPMPAAAWASCWRPPARCSDCRRPRWR